MINNRDIFGLIFALMVAFLSWRVSLNRHKRITPSSPEAVWLPYIVGLLFGGYWLRHNDYYDIRGVLLQLLVYALTPLWVLYNLKLLSQEMVTYGSRCTIAIILLIIAIDMIWSKRW